eukprot:scaffold120092_cov15-Tisochrysis_lutea.AAC.1
MPKGRKCMEGNAYGSNGAPSLLSGLAYPPSDRAAAVQCTAGTHPDAQNAAHAAATQLLELKVRRLGGFGAQRGAHWCTLVFISQPRR